MSTPQSVRSTTHLFVVALFAISMLAPVSMGEVVISPQHSADAKAHAGTSVLPSAWSKMGETVRFHLHSDTPTPPDAIPVGNALTDGLIDYEAPINDIRILDPLSIFHLANDESNPNDKRVVIVNTEAPLNQDPGDGGAHFYQSASHATTEDIRVYGISAAVDAVCGRSEVPSRPGGVGPVQINPVSPQANIGINVRVILHEADGTVRTLQTVNLKATDNSEALPTETTFRFTGAESYGNPAQENGLFVPAGTWMEFEYIPDQLGAECLLHYDTTSFPAWVDVRSDSARVATWNEDRNGKVIVGLPEASKTQASERRFTTVVAHASAWPEYNTYNRSKSGELDTQDRYSWGNGDLQFRIRDLGDTTSGRQPVSPPFVDATQNTNQQNDDEIQILNARCSDSLTWDDNNPSCSGSKGFGSDGVDGHSVKRKLPMPVNAGDSLNVYELQWAYPGGAKALPNGQYRFEVYSADFGLALAPVLTVGLKQIDVELAGPAARTVLAGEPTEYRVTLRNTGAEADTVTVFPSAPGSNWLASINKRTHFLPANGGESTFTLTVTPPSTATVVDSKSVTLTFGSSFPNEVQIAPLTVNVGITAVNNPGVNVEAPRSVQTIQPGQPIVIDGFEVTNKGAARDHFTYVASVPAGNPGWSASVTPQFGAIAAGSIADLRLTVQAPQSAAAGAVVPVTVSAVRVSDAAVLDSDVVQFQVVVQRNLEVTVDGQVKAPGVAASMPRHQGDTYCTGQSLPGLCIGSLVSDPDYDPSALFRVEIANEGFVADTFSLQGTWVGLKSTLTGPGSTGDFVIKDVTGSSACDGAGNADGWRVNLQTDPTKLNGNAHGGSRNPNSASYSDVTVPARSIATVYVELGWVPSVSGGASCQDSNGGISQAAAYDLRVRSTSDPSVQQVVRMMAKTAGPTHDYDEAPQHTTYGVDVSPAPAATVGTVPPTLQKVATAGTATHKLMVQNTGNTQDTLTIAVPEDPAGKWTRTLTVDTSAPSPPDCETRDQGRRLVCRGVGVMDELRINLDVTASGNTLRIGDQDTAVVSVTSQKNGQFTDQLQLVTKLTGSFLFAADPVDSSKDAARGQTIRLPYEIVNQGTAGDSYNLSLVQGPASWLPRFSERQVFVPSDHSHLGSLAVKAPANAAIGSQHNFVVNVQSVNDPAKSDTFGFVARVIDSGTLKALADPTTVFLADSNTVGTASVKARDTTLSRSNAQVAFTANGADLPAGWAVSGATVTDTTSAQQTIGGVPTLQWDGQIGSIQAPAGTLGTSRAILEVRALQSGSNLQATTDVILDLADTYGLQAERTSTTETPITPGGEMVYTMRVRNTGLSEDKVLMSTSTINKPGWTVSLTDAEKLLGPLEEAEFSAIVSAPTTAGQGDKLTFTVIVESDNDATQRIQIPIVTTVGKYGVGLVGDNATGVIGAPGDVLSRTFTVNNTGTLPDELVSTVTLTSASIAQHVTVEVSPARVALDPGQAATVTVSYTLGEDIASGIDFKGTFKVASAFDPSSPAASRSLGFNLSTHEFARADVDGDNIDEYAIDRNNDDTDGFERFLELTKDEGKTTRVADLQRFLTKAARDSFTVEVTNGNNTTTRLDYVIDGDGDGRVDYFLDWTLDDLPDAYWDPDRGHTMRITVFKDVNADGVPDYFVDTDGNGVFDSVFNIRNGKWTALLVIDVDGNGEADFVVDANGNGQVDDNETVLFTRDGRLITVQKVDMTGDGRLDQVFDIDGDGIPDYFIPAGQTESIAIVLRDVDGDGQADWTYDADGDGQRESYYNPVDGTTGMVDSQSVFLDNALKYWYVGAIFLVVVGLFVVLLIVTRR